MPNKRFTISVIIACYRDAGSVLEMHKRLTEALAPVCYNYELIFVNDASPDNAEEILTELAEEDKHVVVVNHTRNFGSQNAFLSGLRVARGDAMVLMDGDLQDPPSLIPEMIEHWLNGYHVVYGVRVKRKETAFRQIAYKLFYRVFRNMASFEVPVDAGDFGLIDRRAADILLDEFPEKLVFLRGLRAYTGLKHIGVDYIRDERFDGVSTNSLTGNLRWAKLAIFSFSQRPLEYISLLAIGTVFLTLGVAIFYLGVYFASFYYDMESPPRGFMTQIILILLLASVQLGCIAIIAEYLGHIYTEVKARPRYLVRDVIDNRRKPRKKKADPSDG